MTTIFFYDTRIGKLGIAEEDGQIIAVLFDGERYDNTWIEKETPLIKKTAKQIQEYLDGKRKTFDIPIQHSSASDFFSKVMAIIEEIPYGQTITYKDIAKSINRPRASRAVGMVCNRNPIPIIIPCHRVIATNGSLTGYKGGLDIKKQLLEMEKSL